MRVNPNRQPLSLAGSAPAAIHPIRTLCRNLGAAGPTSAHWGLGDRDGHPQSMFTLKTSTRFARPCSQQRDSKDGSVHRWRSGLENVVHPHDEVSLSLKKGSLTPATKMDEDIMPVTEDKYYMITLMRSPGKSGSEAERRAGGRSWKRGWGASQCLMGTRFHLGQ